MLADTPTLVSPKELCRMLGIRRRTLFRWIATGLWPEPIRLNARVIRWDFRHVEQAIAARCSTGQRARGQ
ncbi:MAG: hypothetical protein U0840_25535 [Gemmataceae bacterium]